MARRLTVLVVALLSALAASMVSAQSFGYTTSSDSKKWVFSSGKGLSVTMVRATCDIVSIKYNGQELQSSAKGTHVNSGLGVSTVSSIKTLKDAAKTIQVTCETTGLTQYYFFRANENAVYMGTYHSSDLALPELRFLARLDRSTVTTGVAEATLDGMDAAIEAEDVMANSKNITRSKFYSGVPFIQDHVHGVYGPKAGVYFVMSPAAYETSSGGPFFRDINNKCTTVNELTFYMNSDHTRTEDYRYGFHGPYAIVVTDGAAPATTSVDFAFFQGLGLKGFVDSSKRGTVSGTITDSGAVLGKSAVVVGFSNAAAQYWTELSTGSKSFTSPPMKAGTYAVTVYKKQLPVATGSVTVAAGTASSMSIAVTFKNSASTLIWQIGEWDGTPEGFLNADKIHKMHPSDARMAAWKPLTFSADDDADAAFPMALFRGVNDPLTISFALTASEAAAPRTIKIGVSLAQSSARPSVVVNGKWTAPTPASVAVKTRGVTRGVTIGNYIIYEYKIPASALVSGKNSIALGIASGASDPAEPFLHASVVFDALQLE